MANPTVETSIWQALRRQVEALPLSIPAIWPGETESSAARHMLVTTITAPPARVLIGPGKHDRVGTLQIMLRTPLSGLRHEVEQEAAGVIAEHFPADLRMRFGDVCVRVTAAPEVSDGFRDEGFWATPVRVRWQSFA